MHKNIALFITFYSHIEESKLLLSDVSINQNSKTRVISKRRVQIKRKTCKKEYINLMLELTMEIMQKIIYLA